MKNNIKIVLSFIIGVILTGSVGIVLAITYRASDIAYTPSDNTWNVSNVEGAIDDLSATTYKKVCQYVDSNYAINKQDYLSIGTKYLCDPGDNIPRTFYILSKTDKSVDLIMERNIENNGAYVSVLWEDAMNYFNTQPGKTIKQTWRDIIDINLPDVQILANAVGNTNWNYANNNDSTWFYMDSKSQVQTSNSSNKSSYGWLFNYTYNCTSYGCDETTSQDQANTNCYWTANSSAKVRDQYSHTWVVFNTGAISSELTVNAGKWGGPGYCGVRPVITVLKTNLY